MPDSTMGSKTKSREIPLEDFFRNPEKTYYLISPDGNYFSYLAPYKNRLNVFVQKIGETEARRVTNATERDIPAYFWKGNNKILYLQDTGGDEDYKLFSVDRTGENFKALTPFENVTTQILDKLKENEEEILIGLNKRNSQLHDAFRMNVNTGEMSLVAENPGSVTNWITDHDGKLRAAITSDGVNKTLLYRKTEDEEFKPVITTDFRTTLSPLIFTFDNVNVYAASNIGRDKLAIVIYDLENNKELEMLFEHPDVDAGGLEYSKKRKKLTYVSYYTDKQQIKILDEEFGKIYKRLVEELGKDKEVIITGQNDDEDKYLVRTHSDRSLGSYYFYDVKEDKILKLADVSPWLKEGELAEMKPIEYKSRDGMTIHGYLTLPVGRDAKNLPVVVNPHGGPWHRDEWGFTPDVQFFANRGFAVLQMNFRGSTGYGRKFLEASFKQWGKTMQDDITDGVNWLIERGIADPKRIAIYGGSYGGYAVLAGLTFTPDLYAAGVDFVGVSNLFTFMNTIPPYWKPFLETMYEMVGHPENDKELLKAASPVFHADKITAPLFIAQGRKDPRVNVAESDQMVDAMKKRGVEVEYMVKDNEGHGFRNEENRFDFYRAAGEFLQKHLLN